MEAGPSEVANGPQGDNILKFDDEKDQQQQKDRPTREDVRDLLETKIFIFNFTFNAQGSNRNPLSDENPRQKIPYVEIAKHLYENYRLYKVRSNRWEYYSLTPQSYIAHLEGNRGKGLT